MEMTPTSRRQRSQRARCILLSVFVCAIFLCSAAAAQENGAGQPADASSSASPQPQHAEKGSGGLRAGQQPAEESREAAGEDETAKFKQSASVQFLARITGLSLQHAYWLSVVLNFAVVAGVIVWLSKKYLPAVFRDRTAQIQKAMEEARAASQEANRRLAEIEARLSHLDAEITALRTAAEKEGAAEEVRMQAAAEEDARKIVQSAEQEIAAAAKSARRELTAYAASLAVSLAAKQIQIDRGTDEALVRDFAAQLALDGESRKGGQ
jgi:F-type H+-transporting ATPase subunit b